MNCHLDHKTEELPWLNSRLNGGVTPTTWGDNVDAASAFSINARTGEYTHVGRRRRGALRSDRQLRSQNCSRRVSDRCKTALLSLT